MHEFTSTTSEPDVAGIPSNGLPLQRVLATATGQNSPCDRSLYGRTGGGKRAIRGARSWLDGPFAMQGPHAGIYSCLEPFSEPTPVSSVLWSDWKSFIPTRTKSLHDGRDRPSLALAGCSSRSAGKQAGSSLTLTDFHIHGTIDGDFSMLPTTVD